MAHQFGQGAGRMHGRGVGAGGFEQTKYLELLGVAQSLGVAQIRLPFGSVGRHEPGHQLAQPPDSGPTGVGGLSCHQFK
jgi:hypothetical protein